MAEWTVSVNTPPMTASALAQSIVDGLHDTEMTYSDHRAFLLELISEVDEAVMDLEFTRQVANRFMAIIEREEE